MSRIISQTRIINTSRYFSLKINGSWDDFTYRQRMQKLLGGMTLEEVLKKSPYGYGHFQGDNGYRIWRRDMLEGFVQLDVSDKFAKMWIVEQYFQSDRDNKKP